MTRRLLTMLMLCAIVLTAMAQKPRWVGNTPGELNNTYRFVEKVSRGSSVEAARMDGLALLAQDQQLRNAVMMNVKAGMLTDVKQDQTNGQLNENIQNKVRIEMEMDGERFRLQGTVVDEYIESHRDGIYTLHTLYMVAINDHPVFDFPRLTTSYGAAPAVMSVIPGMGQLYKGSTAKGLCILATEALLAGGIILCENQRSDYKNKMHEQPMFAQKYNTKANNWETARNVCIGAAAAVWVYNMIDAAVAKGARRVKVARNAASGLSLSPMLPTEGCGMSMAYRF